MYSIKEQKAVAYPLTIFGPNLTGHPEQRDEGCARSRAEYTTVKTSELSINQCVWEDDDEGEGKRCPLRRKQEQLSSKTNLGERLCVLPNNCCNTFLSYQLRNYLIINTNKIYQRRSKCQTIIGYLSQV